MSASAAPRPALPPAAAAFARQLRAELPALRERFGVRSLALFGSYVRDEQTAASDLDVLVDFSTPPTLFAVLRLEERIAAIVGVRVDLVLRSALKRTIATRVLAEVVEV